MKVQSSKFKVQSLLLAAMAFVMSVSSCGSDDNDEPETPLAAQVAGSYTGNEVVIVDNEESSNETKTYKITKATDSSVDMEIPELGLGMMTIPSLAVKGIALTKDGNNIKGILAVYNGKVTDAKGEEKDYFIKDVTVLLNGNTVVVAYIIERYGRMPYPFSCTFTGTK